MPVSLHKPTSIDQAVLLMSQEPDARYLAGGQTLIAMMNTDLLEPGALISLDEVAGLSEIQRDADGSVRIGAMASHAAIAVSEDLRFAHEVVKQAAAVIAHPAIRNLGTIGGAVCHGDPNADFPAALVAADAMFSLISPSGRRDVSADGFFEDFLTTTLQDGELLEAITLPPADEASHGHYEKITRVDGDYATASVAVTISIDAAGNIQSARIVLGACGPKPIHSQEVEQQMIGAGADDANFAAKLAEAARTLAKACDPLDDVRGSAEYRRLLVTRMVPAVVRRALAEATRQARGN